MKNAPSAESLFKTLKAENEPWLGDVFVSLPAFELIEEKRSTILYGESGSGKTAMLLELKRRQKENIFVTTWLPEPILEEATAGTALAQQALRQALRACIENLVLDGDLPHRLGEPSEHLASALQWFLQNYLPFDAGFYIQSQTDHLSQDDIQWYLSVLKQSFFSVIKEGTGLKDQLRLLLTLLQAAKYDQLWLAVDGLERWTPLQTGEQVEASLDAVLSTLVFLDLPQVAFKFFIPATLKRSLHKTAGVQRHRSSETDLEWSVEALQTMVNKRLTHALFSKKDASLDSLCDGGEFLNWLKDYGGASPRAWLEFTAPLVAEYQKRGKRLSAAQTREFIRQHPAPLRLHRERRDVWLGRKCISIGSTPEFRVLEYLSARSEKIGSLEELYYYAYKELNIVPDKSEHDWVPPQTWRGAMDTLIWRLRQKIEPNPKEPLYLVTHHGKGLELFHTEA